ncbi:MAG: acyltransferase family protein [Eubacterium sp.]|nr:acyltransferase family protein [Eubacterium sp.]MDD7210451.1 acyltransferase family protein [Lachnospiraceae bacterium]
MAIFLILLAIIIISNIEMPKTNQFNNDYIDIRHTNVIKGIFVLLVLLGHSIQYISVKGPWDKPYLTFHDHIEQMVVSMFLFYSGYGMIISVMKKGFSYIKTFPVKRFLIVLFNFDLVVLLFCLMNLCLKIHYDWKTILLSFTGWVGIGNSNWYMFAIFGLYIIFFLSFYLLRWYNGKGSLYLGMTLVTILTVAFVYWEIRMGQPSWYYNTMILFAFGGWYALFHEQVEKILMKSDNIYFIAVIIITLFYWVSSKMKNYGGIEVYSIWAVVFTSAIVLATMKINIKSTFLEWIGQHVFSIYILQRIPMIIFSKTGFTAGSPYAFVTISFIITLGLSVMFDYWVGKLDKCILRVLLKE